MVLCHSTVELIWGSVRAGAILTLRITISIFLVRFVNNLTRDGSVSEFNFSNPDREAEALESASTEDILRWSWDRFGQRVAMGTAFGATGLVLLDLAHKTVPGLRVFTIDTGFLFPETLELKAKLEARYGFDIESVVPLQSIEEQAAEHGDELYRRDSDQCCYLRKVEPLHRKLNDLDGWITSLRRDQGKARKEVRVLSPFPTHGDRVVAKINPMATWDRKRVWDYILENDVPYNPLMDQGYPSIGCRPCTSAVSASEDERAGRWVGSAKTECGIHTIMPADASVTSGSASVVQAGASNGTGSSQAAD